MVRKFLTAIRELPGTEKLKVFNVVSHGYVHFVQRVHETILCPMLFIRTIARRNLLLRIIDRSLTGFVHVPVPFVQASNIKAAHALLSFCRLKAIALWNQSHAAESFNEEDRSFVVVNEINNTYVVQEISHRCESCGEQFDTEADLLVHRTERSILRTREILRKSGRKYTCDECCESFAKKAQLFKHRRGRCKRSATTDSKQCEDKAMKTKKQKNQQAAVSADPIECNVCHKVFKKKKYLNVHKTLHGAPHICHMCGIKLTSEYYLKIHIRRHNKEFTEFCEVCNKGFYLKANLKTHMSVHSDAKPCICDICHKSFGNRVYLRSHMKIHSKPENRRKYRCHICEFETFYSYCYKEHLWTHTGESQVACEVCGKLIRKEYMKIHIRIHTGEKPEICEFCGKAFSSKKYLIKHRRTHTGEKPYKCEICDKCFTQRGTLSAHLRRHENPKR
ncbi:hypothetical protein K0M31_007801 [Melipona bicolor]|uniref:C2H2-type domain-containing protein n=1 Tax=Melipona bicolor TaxID=60889 RepID=A0AA40KW49_9HYME|nr:hypothetical protein K0M31_007801 [Melipona bicolor]